MNITRQQHEADIHAAKVQALRDASQDTNCHDDYDLLICKADALEEAP